MRLCKGCKHFEDKNSSDTIKLHYAYCSHPGFRDPVFGTVIMQCINMRAEDGYCGRQGKYWEAK